MTKTNSHITKKAIKGNNAYHSQKKANTEVQVSQKQSIEESVNSPPLSIWLTITNISLLIALVALRLKRRIKKVTPPKETSSSKKTYYASHFDEYLSLQNKKMMTGKDIYPSEKHLTSFFDISDSHGNPLPMQITCDKDVIKHELKLSYSWFATWDQNCPLSETTLKNLNHITLN